MMICAEQDESILFIQPKFTLQYQNSLHL